MRNLWPSIFITFYKSWSFLTITQNWYRRSDKFKIHFFCTILPKTVFLIIPSLWFSIIHITNSSYNRLFFKRHSLFTYSARSNRRFRKKSFIFSKFSVPLVRLWSCFVHGQISIPSTNYVSIQMSIFKIWAFKSINLSFKIA